MLMAVSPWRIAVFLLLLSLHQKCQGFSWENEHSGGSKRGPGRRLSQDGSFPSTPKTSPAWTSLHEQYSSKAAATVEVDVIFAGDSLTEGWSGNFLGKPQHLYGDSNVVYSNLVSSLGVSAFEFGIAGDKVANLRWRLQNGELPPTLQAMTVVICIGINDVLGGSSTSSVASEIKGLVDWIRTTYPTTAVLVVGLLPETYPTKDDAPQAASTAVNSNLLSLHDGKFVRFVDCTSQFEISSTTVNESYYIKDGFPFLHLSSAGYQQWAQCISPPIGSLVEYSKSQAVSSNSPPPASAPVVSPILPSAPKAPVLPPEVPPIAAPTSQPPTSGPILSPVVPLTPTGAPAAAPSVSPQPAPKSPFVVVPLPTDVPAVPPVLPPVGSPASLPAGSTPNVAPSSPFFLPTAAPVSIPVSGPVSIPVSTPVSTPVSAPVSIPVSTPINAPVSTPAISPPSASPLALPSIAPAGPASSPATTPSNVPTSSAVPTVAPTPAKAAVLPPPSISPSPSQPGTNVSAPVPLLSNPPPIVRSPPPPTSIPLQPSVSPAVTGGSPPPPPKGAAGALLPFTAAGFVTAFSIFISLLLF